MRHKFFAHSSFGAALAGFVGVGLPAGSQAAVADASVLNDARVSGKFDQRLGEQIRGVRPEGEREGLALSLMATQAYDDNIFRTATDEQEDMVTSVVPRVSYTVGQPSGRLWLRGAYEGTGVHYWDNSSESRIDHRAKLEATVRRKMFKFAYAGSFARLGSPDADVGGSSDRSEWNNRMVLGWEPRGKTSLEVFAAWALVDQDESALNDVDETTFGLSVLHRYSSKTQLGMTYEVGTIGVDGSPDQDIQRLTGMIAWQPRRKIGVSLEAGVDYRDYGGGDTNWEPIFTGRVTWNPRRGTDVYLAGYRREEASAFFDGENFIVTGAVLGVNQRVHGNWSSRLELGWEDSDYFATSGAGSGRSDQALFVRPTISYLSEAGHALQFFYQWSESDSTESGFGYANQEVGASIECQF